MPFDPNIHHRRSIRLKAYDYSQPGAYFVTVVCKDREPLFDEPSFKAIAESAWEWLARQYEHVELDEHVIMPTHIHGILLLGELRRGGSRTATTSVRYRKPLGRLIAAFKTVSTKRINNVRGTQGVQVWQRNYYERVIRNAEELLRVRQYIIDNPVNWEVDPENPNQPVPRT